MLGTVSDTLSEAQRTAMDIAGVQDNATGLYIITTMVGSDETQMINEQYAIERNVDVLAKNNPGILKLLGRAEKEKSLKAVRNVSTNRYIICSYNILISTRYSGILRPLSHDDLIGMIVTIVSVKHLVKEGSS